MKKILFLTKYSQMGASSRYRSFQYLPFLDEADIEYEVSPLFDDSYLTNLYKLGSGSKKDLIYAFMHRIRALLKARSYNLLVIEYELLPYFPPLLECLLSRLGVRYVVDYDDALFHQYDQHANPLVRKVLKNKIAMVMRNAELVIAGNNYLADYATQAGAKRVEIIPTVIDLDRYQTPVTQSNKNDEFIIGWIGSPTTAKKHLQTIVQALAEVCCHGNVKLRVIGSGEITLPGVNVEVLPWSGASEVELMHTFDVGIMPLPDDLWARGKCGFKLIQYMACGLPVVASPVGVNVDIVEEGVNGFLATTQDEWVRALTTLRDDPALRSRFGHVGRDRVEEEYSLQVTGPKLVGMLKEFIV